MISYRLITAEDEEFLYRVYASTRAEELVQTDWDDAQKEIFLRMQFNAQHSHYQTYYTGALFQIILRNNEPAGRLYLAHWKSEIRLIDIALLPAFRGKGLGTTIIKRLQAEGAAAGLPLTIHVEKFNPALRLYERLGFRAIEDKGVYWFMEWRAEG
jgi:GNAT superfamily N-acetyltransferase